MQIFKALTQAAALCALGASLLPAQTQGKQIFSLPAVITEPGNYQLRLDSYVWSGPGPAIRVQAGGVTVDLGGGQILGPGNNTGMGIEVAGATGVTIKNGNLANFGLALRVADSSNVTVQDLNIRARDLLVSSGPPEIGIMIVQSVGVVVRNNSLNSVGLGVFVRGGMSRGNMIVGNAIIAGANGVIGICYNPTDTDPNGPRYDAIETNLISGFRTGIQFSSASKENSVRRNTIFHKGVTAIELNGTGSIDMDNVKIQIK